MTVTTTANRISTPNGVHMNKELFGIFGDRETFDKLRPETPFDVVVEGSVVTVGIRDRAVGHPGRTDVYDPDEGLCVVWGEARFDHRTEAAKGLYEAWVNDGVSGLSRLNGSYIAVIEKEGQAIVVGDTLRSWECFYTDLGDVRAFGTDLAILGGLPSSLPVVPQAILEFLHLGTVLGDKTLFKPIQRIPFDAYLTVDGTESLERMVYDPREFEYAADLTGRLRRAIKRRDDLPKPRGILLSAGEDSRSILPFVQDVDCSYTVGTRTSQEVSVAKAVSKQYGVEHKVLPTDERYLMPNDRKVLYSQGLRESLHVHQGGYNDLINATSIYHGLLYDTLLKGYFLERDGVEILGTKICFHDVSSDVEPLHSLLGTLGFLPHESADIVDHAHELIPELRPSLSDPDPTTVARDSLQSELDRCRDRADSVHNAMDLAIIRNQPAMCFRTHLADNYIEAFVGADSELVEWHLRTPPKYRNPETVHTAIAGLDENVFRHRPPDRLRGSMLLNQAERFARRKLPLLESVEPAWPQRRSVYHQHDLGGQLFPDHPRIRELPPRLQLRLYDLRWWLSMMEPAA